VTALMTSFYMFRLVFLTFFGKPRNQEIHTHESPKLMTVPLWILAFFSVVLGLIGSPLTHFWFQDFMHTSAHGEGHGMNLLVTLFSILAAAGGALLAWIFYLKKPELPQQWTNQLKPFYLAALNKFWLDEIYAFVIVKPFRWLARFLFRVDENVVDRLVNETGIATVRTSTIKGWIDQYIVDGLVNLIGGITKLSSILLKRIQTGFIQHYMLVLFTGVLIMIFLQLR